MVFPRDPLWDQWSFNIFISGSGIEFSADTKLSGAVDTIEGRDSSEKDLDTLKKWAHLTVFLV